MNTSPDFRDRGSVSVAAVLLLVVVFSAAGLIFDGAQYFIAQRDASNAAEGAARAAAATVEPGRTLSETVAGPAAIAHAQALGVPASDITVRVNPRSVEVTIIERRTGVFVGLAGQTIVATATGTASVEYS
jgi:Flp pilus assembly protein TadG